MDEQTRLFIANKISQVMKEKHLSRNDVASACNVSLSQVDKIKAGNREVKLDFAEKFAKLTDTNILDYLTPDIAIKKINNKSWTIYDDNKFFVQYLKELGFISNIQSLKSRDDLGNSDGIETVINIGYGNKSSKEEYKQYIAAKKAYDKKKTPETLDALQRASLWYSLMNNDRVSTLSHREFLEMKDEIDKAVEKTARHYLQNHIVKKSYGDTLTALLDRCKKISSASDPREKEFRLNDMIELLENKLNEYEQ